MQMARAEMRRKRAGDYGVISPNHQIMDAAGPVNGFGFAGRRPEAGTDSAGNLGATRLGSPDHLVAGRRASKRQGRLQRTSARPGRALAMLPPVA